MAELDSLMTELDIFIATVSTERPDWVGGLLNGLKIICTEVKESNDVLNDKIVALKKENQRLRYLAIQEKDSEQELHL